MLKDVTLGQYFPGNTVIHRLDPRTKLIWTVLYIVTLFLARSGRPSATLVGAVAGVFTTASFLILHLCGSFTGNWGVWNYSYFALIKGVTYNGVFYQGVDWLSWVLLFHIPVCCLPCSWVCFRQYLKLKHDAAK